MGHYILSVMDFPLGGRRVAPVPQFSASFLEWEPPRPRPNLDHGGICLPFTDEGLRSFSPPSTFSACKAVTLGDAREGNNSDPRKIIEKLHVNWGHASAQQIKSKSTCNFPLKDATAEVPAIGKCGALSKARHTS